MGKATIAGGGTAGLYNVTVDYGAAEIAAQVAVIDQQIADRQADLADAVAAVAATDAAFTTALAAADVAIDLYAADPTDDRRQAMNAAAQELARISGERRVAEARRASLATIILSLQADKAQLQDVRTSETRAAWCVDYTEDATGEVATIEVPGEVGTLVIAPGGRSPTAADGKLVARGAQAAHQAYYNAAILPGWQRFVHPYRVGTLTAKDGDTGTVNLDAAVSSAADLQVRDAETISAPIVYMTCNGRVFDPGDRVVVDTRGPTIIGFESNPKSCGPEFRYFNIRVERIPTGIGSFENFAWVATSCDPIIIDGLEYDAINARDYHDGLTLQANPTGTTCELDSARDGYVTSCASGAQTTTGDPAVIGQLSGLGTSNPIGQFSAGQSLTATPGAATTIEGFDAYESLTVYYSSHALIKIIRPDAFARSFGCLDPVNRTNHGIVGVIDQTTLPEIAFGGLEWEPLGILSGDFYDVPDAVPPFPQPQPGVSFEIRALYRSKAPA